jgi:translocation and assembly module TamB
LLERFAGGGYTPVARETPAADAGDTTPAAEASAFDNASFSVTLALPDNVVVRGRDLRARSGSFGLGDINATLGGALTIAKESGESPTVRGRLAFVRGQYTFQGRRFTILRDSVLQFTGGDALNPGLDVRAERQIGGVTAEVRVTGFARSPELMLTSNPPLDQGDVLSLIVFNQTMNELGTGEKVSLAGRAGTLAARALATPLADSVMRALDFDLFEIETNDDVSTGGTVTVGRQVNDRLFVGFRQNFGTDDVSQVSFEYRINEFLRLVTSFAQGADRSRSIPRAETAGLDLFFVIRR